MSVFKAGKMDGDFNTWHENGKKKQESHLKAGQLQGPSVVLVTIALHARWSVPNEKGAPG